MEIGSKMGKKGLNNRFIERDRERKENEREVRWGKGWAGNKRGAEHARTP